MSEETKTVNTLVIIGWMGAKTGYLNLSVKEAQKRWLHDNNDVNNAMDDNEIDGITKNLVFRDSFGVYDAWAES